MFWLLLGLSPLPSLTFAVCSVCLPTCLSLALLSRLKRLLFDCRSSATTIITPTPPNNHRPLLVAHTPTSICGVRCCSPAAASILPAPPHPHHHHQRRRTLRRRSLLPTTSSGGYTVVVGGRLWQKQASIDSTHEMMLLRDDGDDG